MFYHAQNVLPMPTGGRYVPKSWARFTERADILTVVDGSCGGITGEHTAVRLAVPLLHPTVPLLHCCCTWRLGGWLAGYILNLRNIEVWVHPGHQLDVPVLFRQTLENDVRDVLVRDRFLHLGQ